MNIYDIILIIAEIVIAVILFFIAGKAKKLPNTKWRLAYLLPAMICVLLIALGGWEIRLLPVCIGAVIAAAGFMKEKVSFRHIVSGILGVLTICGMLLCLLVPGYRAKDYLGDFETGFAAMKERYSLAEHKQINWDSLYDEYRPRFEEADRTQDEAANTLAWLGLVGQLYDGHCAYLPDGVDQSVEYPYLREALGSGFGLALLTDAEGNAVAVNVDPSLETYGIRNGTIVTAWNGMAPAEAAKLSPAYDILTYPNAVNAEFYQYFLTAGIGTEQAEVTFLDENGADKTVQLEATGDYYDIIANVKRQFNGNSELPNLGWQKVSDTAACLRISEMLWEGKLDVENYSSMKVQLRDEIQQLRDEGIRDIIIDLRGNSGGHMPMAQAIAELFNAEGEYVTACDGVWDSDDRCYKKAPDGSYEVGRRCTCVGEQVLGNGRIVVLVSDSTFSAAEYLTRLLGLSDNVTIMGFTETLGSAMPMGTVELKYGILGFPFTLLLEEDGSVLIAGDADGKTGIGLDVQIPFDQTAIHSIFDMGEDYLMQKAVEYLEQAE